jgi:hypothetical protein
VREDTSNRWRKTHPRRLTLDTTVQVNDVKMEATAEQVEGLNHDRKEKK